MHEIQKHLGVPLEYPTTTYFQWGLLKKRPKNILRPTHYTVNKENGRVF